MWSKCVWVTRIASTVSIPSALDRREQPLGLVARVDDHRVRRRPCARTMKQFSCTGPTVNMRDVDHLSSGRAASCAGAGGTCTARCSSRPGCRSAARTPRTNAARLDPVRLRPDEQQERRTSAPRRARRAWRRLPRRRRVQPLARAPASRSASCARLRVGGRPVRPARLDRARRRFRGAWCVACAWSGPLCMELSAGPVIRSVPAASSIVRRLRPGGRPGSPSNAARGASPTSSALRPGSRAARSPRRPRASGRRAVVLDVGRDLRDVARRTATGRSRGPTRSPSGPPSRIARGDRLRVLERRRRASSTLKATSGGRAATSTAPAVGCSRCGPKSGRQLAGSIRAPAPPGRRGAARPACARRRARRTGTPAARARSPSRSPSTSASAHAAPRSAGVEVHDRRDVERADARVDARRGARGRSAAIASRAPPGRPARARRARRRA